MSAREPLVLLADALRGFQVEALAFHPQDPLLAIGGRDTLGTGPAAGALALWDLARREEAAFLPSAAECLAFHPSGYFLASAALAPAVRVWRLERDGWTPSLEFELVGHVETVSCLAYSPDGMWLAVGGDDHTLELWEAETHRRAATIEVDTQLKILCFSPDGRYLYSGNGNASCYQFDVQRLLGLATQAAK
jgi:WD40 repeat protein